MSYTFLHKAQKLGLVDAPPARLTDQEWQAVKSKSNDRKDSAEPCVICKEEFGTHDQVIVKNLDSHLIGLN